jgi:hypothetical protein
MSPDFARIVALLEQDVACTLGDAHGAVVRASARAIVRFGLPDPETKLVEEVQQSIHDTFVDTTWPACPRHRTHPLWYANGAWWCTQDSVVVAPLGGLADNARPR